MLYFSQKICACLCVRRAAGLLPQSRRFFVLRFCWCAYLLCFVAASFALICELSFSPPPWSNKKRPCSREHGQKWTDLPSELPYGIEHACSHGMLWRRPCGFVSAETVPYRTEGDSTRVKLPFYNYLEKNRKIGRSETKFFQKIFWTWKVW